MINEPPISPTSFRQILPSATAVKDVSATQSSCKPKAMHQIKPNTPLKVGLLLDSYDVAAWTYQMIENIQSSHYAQIELVVLNCNEPPKENKTLFEKITRNKSRLPYLAVRRCLELVYEKVIERNTYLPDADQPKNCSGLLAGAKVVEVTTKRKTWSDYFHESDIDAVKKLDIDILVRSGFGIIRGDMLNAAHYGIWSFHHGDNALNRGGPAGYWESMQQWPETGSILQILSEDLDNGQVLYKSFSCTDSMSVTDNKNGYYWKSLLFMTRKMKELHKLGADEFFAKVDAENLHPQFYSERLYTVPTNWELAKLTLSRVVNKIKLQYQERFRLDQWILMYHLRDELSTSLWRYKKIIPPKDKFWADPHILQRDDKYYVFFEEYLYETGKGHISVLTIDEDGNYSEPTTVLNTEHHLSYPFVFEHEGAIYMVPESIENKTIQLYKCVGFPHKWEHQHNLIDNIQAVDATLFEHEGKWWMFANIAEQEGSSVHDELHIFYADSPLSTNWKPHSLNPVVSDCKVARPAGKIFTENGRIYRPSQNCSVRYGYGFNLNEIELLTTTEYKETTVSRVEPNWEKHLVGTHTFNRVGNLHVIDALVNTSKR